MRQWQEDPVTQVLLEAIHNRINELYLSLVRIPFSGNYDLQVAETRGKITQLQVLASLGDIKELLDNHVEWEN